MARICSLNHVSSKTANSVDALEVDGHCTRQLFQNGKSAEREDVVCSKTRAVSVRRRQDLDMRRLAVRSTSD